MTHGRPGGHRPGPNPGPEERRAQSRRRCGHPRRSRSSSAAARSCASATVTPRTSRRSRPARSRSTWRWASAACRAAGSRRSTARSRAARRPSATTSSPTRSAHGGVAAFIDAEHALDPGYAKNVGVNVDDLLVSQPDTGEQALEIAETLIRSQRRRRRRHRLGGRARAAGRDRGRDGGQLRRAAGAPDEPGAAQADRRHQPQSKTALIFTNQLREKIGVMFGNPETTPGGRR